MMQGLRTLVLATRILDEQQYQEWNRNYELAASSLEDREARIAAVSEKIERDLELVGVTAIEDKLQEGVPQAINSLITAGIKVPKPLYVTAKCSGLVGAQQAPHIKLSSKNLPGWYFTVRVLDADLASSGWKLSAPLWLLTPAPC